MMSKGEPSITDSPVKVEANLKKTSWGYREKVARKVLLQSSQAWSKIKE